MIQQQQEEETGTDKAPAPCTDFDMAYFNSYAHLGIHEEMIKVPSVPIFLWFYLFIIFQLWMFEDIELYFLFTLKFSIFILWISLFVSEFF